MNDYEINNNLNAENTADSNEKDNTPVNDTLSANEYTFRAETEYRSNSAAETQSGTTTPDAAIPANNINQQQYYYNGSCDMNGNYNMNSNMNGNINNNGNNYGNPINTPYVPNNYANQGYTGYDYNGYYYGYNMNSEPIKKEPSKASKFFKKAGLICASAAAFGLIAGGAFLGSTKLYYTINPDAVISNDNNAAGNAASSNGQLILDPVTDAGKKIGTTTLAEKVNTESTDVSAVIEAAMPSVVAIQSTFNTQSWYGIYESTGGGSGIIVGKNDTELLIATNNHVIENAVNIEVTLNDNSVYPASIKGRDSVADLAVIAIKLSDMTDESLAAIRIATLGDSESVKVGQMAIAIGNALGYGQSTTVGYISAKDREVSVDNSTMILLQTDAAINPGNSGGALLNIKGEVIGINSVKYASDSIEGMGFAIPISRASAILDDLMTREVLADDEKGYLGVYIDDVTSDVAAVYNWPVGVYVSELVEGGAAEKAGIYVGDIITAINSTTVTTGNMLKEKITSYRYGTVVTITLQRMVNGTFQEMNIEVELGQSSTQVTPAVEEKGQ